MTSLSVGYPVALRSVFASFAAYMRESKLSPFAIVAAALSPVTYGIIVITGYGQASGALLLGCVAAGLWGSCYTQAAMIVTRERRSGTLQQLAACPAPLSAMLLGRLLAAGCQALAVAPVIAVVIGVLFGGIHDFAVVLWIIALAVTALGLFGMSLFLMGAFARWRYSAGMVNGLFGSIVFLGGFFVPLSALSVGIRAIGFSLPPAWAIQALRPGAMHPWADILFAAILALGWLVGGFCYLSGAQRRLRKIGFYQV